MLDAIIGNKLEMSPITLRKVECRDEFAFKAAINEFKNEADDFEFAFQYNENEEFEKYVEKLEKWSTGNDLPDKFVPSTFLVGVIENKIIGRISIRHILNEYLFNLGGHVGYGIAPSERKKGYGTQLLKLALPVVRSIGIDKILITADDENIASWKIIEKNGGILENTVDNLGKLKRRYWIY